MRHAVKSKVSLLLCLHIFHWISIGVCGQEEFPILTDLLGNWRQLNEVLRPVVINPYRPAQSKVVFPVPEDVIKNRSYLPDLGVLTDLVFLFLPRDFPASGVARLSRDLFESEQCVQYVGCEMTKMTHRYEPLHWVRNFLQDFPAQGDFADRLRQGSLDAVTRLEEKKTTNNEEKSGSTKTDICSFSCHPIKSLSRGLKILSLLHDLVRTVK